MLRLLVVVMSYLLSSLGLLIMFQLIIESIRTPRPAFIDWGPTIVWLAALACHLLMSIAWIIGKRLGRLWVTSGILAGIASFMVWPIIAVAIQVPEFMPVTATVFTLMAYQLLLFSPCFLLAVWLVRFHWSRSASEGS